MIAANPVPRRERLRRTLTQCGLQVLRATESSAKALRKADLQRADFLLIDLDGPGTGEIGEILALADACQLPVRFSDSSGLSPEQEERQAQVLGRRLALKLASSAPLARPSFVRGLKPAV